MTNEIIPYVEMCQREGMSLQRGMNFKTSSGYAIILMSVRRNAPYQDRMEADGSVLIYEGHDQPKHSPGPDPKSLDQLERTPNGTLTENGKFHQAAQEHRQHGRPPVRVKVYEKILGGVWSYNGLFDLVDSWRESDGKRQVFKFKLAVVPEDALLDPIHPVWAEDRRRIIPTAVKLEVWKRDGGKCIQCGAKDELHFDHIIPFSKGGTSLGAANVQLLCARHNLEKSDKIK